jgi:glutaredoxin
VQYEFTDVDLLSNEEKKIIIEDVRKLNPQCTFPTLVIGDKVIVGFDEAKIRKALGL